MRGFIGSSLAFTFHYFYLRFLFIFHIKGISYASAFSSASYNSGSNHNYSGGVFDAVNTALQAQQLQVQTEQLEIQRKNQERDLRQQFLAIQKRLEQETQPQEMLHILIEIHDLDYEPATDYALKWIRQKAEDSPLDRLKLVRVFLKDVDRDFEPKALSLIPDLIKTLTEMEDWKPYQPERMKKSN